MEKLTKSQIRLRQLIKEEIEYNRSKKINESLGNEQISDALGKAYNWLVKAVSIECSDPKMKAHVCDKLDKIIKATGNLLDISIKINGNN